MNEDRDYNERFYFQITNDPVVLLTDLVKGGWRFKRGQRRKQCFRMSVWIGGADIVLHIFGSASHRVIHVVIQDFVQLQDIILCDGDHIKIFVDDIQYIPIPSDLLLIPIPRCCFFLNELPYAGIRCDDPFDGVGCFRALDLSDLHQLFQFFWPLFQVKFLFTGLLINRRYQAKNRCIPFLLPDCRIIEVPHTLTPSFISLNSAIN